MSRTAGHSKGLHFRHRCPKRGPNLASMALVIGQVEFLPKFGFCAFGWSKALFLRGRFGKAVMSRGWRGIGL